MLVLSRYVGEEIFIGGDIRIMITGIRGDKVRVGITAPESVRVFRKELLDPTEPMEAAVAPAVMDQASEATGTDAVLTLSANDLHKWLQRAVLIIDGKFSGKTGVVTSYFNKSGVIHFRLSVGPHRTQLVIEAASVSLINEPAIAE